MHRRVLPEWGNVVYLDCVHLAGISWSPPGDRVTAPCRFSLSPDRVKGMFVLSVSIGTVILC